MFTAAAMLWIALWIDADIATSTIRASQLSYFAESDALVVQQCFTAGTVGQRRVSIRGAVVWGRGIVFIRHRTTKPVPLTGPSARTLISATGRNQRC